MHHSDCKMLMVEYYEGLPGHTNKLQIITLNAFYNLVTIFLFSFLDS